MSDRLGIIDYGAGNLYSVLRGVRAAGLEPTMVKTPTDAEHVDALLLPGVGAFGAGMEKLANSGLDRVILSFVESGRPLIGICLGMQMLMTRSFEFGEHRGLNLIPGDVIELPRTKGWPVPNVGWSELTFCRSAEGTPFGALSTGTDIYHAHSFHCVTTYDPDTVATIPFGEGAVAALVSRGNVHGCQFHPEISGPAGISVLSAIARLAPTATSTP